MSFKVHDRYLVTLSRLIGGLSSTNRQIVELTSIVKALTEKISNSKEGNNQDVLNTEASTRSDIYFFADGKNKKNELLILFRSSVNAQFENDSLEEN